MKAIILAGGRGVRLHPYTKILPKPLIPLDDMAILHIILLQLCNSGFTEVTLSICYKAQMIENYFGDGRWLGLKIRYSREHKFLGTAGPLALIPEFDEPTLVMNSDLLTTICFADVFAAHQHQGTIATVVLHNYSLGVEFGVVNIDSQQRIIDYTEKPNFDFLVSSGIYVLNPAILSHIQPGEYLDMPHLLRKVLAQNHIINSYHFDGDWYDIGTLDQLQQATEVFRRQRSKFLTPNNQMPNPSHSMQDLRLATEVGV